MTDGDAFAAIKAQLIDRTGHHYYADKDAQLRERIGQRMLAVGAETPAAYLDALEGTSGEAEWRRLESAVTINETFFFRFADQFAALRQHILPELIAARAERRRLRIWSAGCSTGAEPYSLAVVVHELLGDALPDWQVSILGTDIDEAALAAAREGRFGSWALRTVSEAERERLFVVEGRHYTICPQYRGLVRFERHNLLSLLEGGGALQLSDFDLVLCRNVLIYFSAERAAAIAGALGQRIAEDGWLLLGHAEPGPSREDGLVAVPVGSALAYRRADAEPQRALLPPPPPPSPAPREVPDAPRPVRRPHASPRVAAPEPPEPPRERLEAVRAALDCGLLDAADRAVRDAIANNPESPRAHFLHALALAGLGRRGEAEAALGRALYLDPSFAMAHYLLGVLGEEAGRTEAAVRAYAGARRQIANLPAGAPVAEGEGMTVADLEAAIRWRMARAS